MPAACDRIAKRLKELGIKIYTPARLLKQAQQLAAGTGRPQEETDEEPIFVHDVLSDTPVPDDVVVPGDWTLNAEGTSRIVIPIYRRSRCLRR